MKSRKTLIIGLVAVVGVAAVVILRQPASQTAQVTGATPAVKSAPGRGGGAPLPVYTHQVVPRTLSERITATGSVYAEESVELVSELSGKAVWVAFDEGSRVAQGDVLLRLDDTELRAELARAESRVGLARTQAERQVSLAESGGTTRDSLDTAVSEVSVREAELALVKAQLAKAEIRAPFDGVVGLRYVSVGAFITPSTRIATLQNIDTIKVEFAVAERHLDRVKRDASVTVSIAGLNEPFVGKIYAIEPRIDVATRTLRLRARVENPGGRALPGGFATVEMGLQEVPNALLVPATALVAGLNQQQVYVVEDGKAQPRRVQIGLRLAREVQILSGLEPNARVITSGQIQLRPGMAVEPVASPGARDSVPAQSATKRTNPPLRAVLEGGIRTATP